MHTAVVCAVWLTHTQSLSLCSDQVINLWKGFAVKDDQVMLQHIKALGELHGSCQTHTTLSKQNGATTWRKLFGQDEAGKIWQLLIFQDTDVRHETGWSKLNQSWVHYPKDSRKDTGHSCQTQLSMLLVIVGKVLMHLIFLRYSLLSDIKGHSKSFTNIIKIGR